MVKTTKIAETENKVIETISLKRAFYHSSINKNRIVISNYLFQDEEDARKEYGNNFIGLHNEVMLVIQKESNEI